MFGKASVSATSSVVDLAVSWLSVSFTILMNVYEQICDDYAHACCKFCLLDLFFIFYLQKYNVYSTHN